MTTGSALRAVRRRPRWGLWSLLAVSAAVVGHAVPPYLTGDAGDAKVPIDPDVALHYLSLAVHAVPGGLALVIGPLQCVPRLRARRPGLHRAMGRVYLVSVVVASAAAVFATAVTRGGFAVQVAFSLLVAAWLYTATMAYRCVRRGETGPHRIWMIRNYALTFPAATLRLYLLIGLLLKKTLISGLDFDELYTACVWASVLGNVLVAEYVIVQRASAPARHRHSAGPATERGTHLAKSGG